MKNSQFLIAAAFGLTLSGCGAMGDNTSMYSVHQPVVERSNFVLDVNAGGSGIVGAEKIRVAEWFDALELGYGDRVSIDYGGSLLPILRAHTGYCWSIHRR
jgi:pilus assembly protein CpaD